MVEGGETGLSAHIDRNNEGEHDVHVCDDPSKQPKKSRHC